MREEWIFYSFFLFNKRKFVTISLAMPSVHHGTLVLINLCQNSRIRTVQQKFPTSLPLICHKLSQKVLRNSSNFGK